MKSITTPDGSVTFHNEQFDEAYHSKSGAKEEAVKKFVEPCKIAELAKSGKIRILDVCFGLGYNSAAAIDAALTVNPDCVIEIIGLEIDEIILKEILNLPNSFDCYSLFKEAVKNKYACTKNNIKITILLGDAVQTINNLNRPKGWSIKCRDTFAIEIISVTDTLIKKNKNPTSASGGVSETTKTVQGEFDAIFLDPFSPKKCPQLWTKEFFDDLYRLMKKNSRLATYSCARIVRDNLKNAGFTIQDGPKLWRRGPSTIGVK